MLSVKKLININLKIFEYQVIQVCFELKPENSKREFGGLANIEKETKLSKKTIITYNIERIDYYGEKFDKRSKTPKKTRENCLFTYGKHLGGRKKIFYLLL